MRTLSVQYDVSALQAGSSLGNLACFARLDSVTDVCGLWSAIDNRHFVGEWNISISADGAPLEPHDTVFTPEGQRTILRGSELSVGKRFFLPLTEIDSRSRRFREMAAGIYLIELSNASTRPVAVEIGHEIRFPAKLSLLFTKQPPPVEQQRKVRVRTSSGHCEIRTVGRPSETCIFGSTSKWNSLTADDTDLRATWSVQVAPGEIRCVPFVLSYSPKGARAALSSFRRGLHAPLVLAETISNYGKMLDRSRLYTPERAINRGIDWAKVDTIRVQHRYRSGNGFTNDPPQDIVVFRDLAWYLFGADYLTPEFCSGLIELFRTTAFHSGGKVTEYIHADERSPAKHDYRLNINDDTPLMVLGLYHHALTCRSGFSLKRVYPLMARACRWIMTQMADGLVRCASDGTGVWGICGWRNIIEGYNLTGAVTEINAESYAALRAAADAAEQLGRKRDAGTFGRAASDLREAIEHRLRSDRTGMYLLNLGNDGIAYHDITGDLVFPVMFGIAGEEVADRILRALTAPEMWTEFGSRTVSPREKTYDPEFGYQLVGGVWPNLTAWIGFCLREKDPQKLVEGMLNCCRLTEIERPVDFGYVVPGEFPERLHGESFRSLGMPMSPWMPPTLLWLATEGLLGVQPSTSGICLRPSLPAAWKWLAVKDLLFRGRKVSAFLYEGILYASEPADSPFPVKAGAAIGAECNNPDIFTIGLRLDEGEIIFAASDAGGKGTIITETGRKIPVDLSAGEAILSAISAVKTRRRPAVAQL